MNWAALIVIFSVSWWMILFMVLPIGIQSGDAENPKHYGAAPMNPRIRQKLLLTTGLCVPVSAIMYWLLVGGALQWVL